MRALQTQFDDKRLSNAVATPTCSSCCCCCCCLATTVTSSALLALHIDKEGKKHQVHNRRLLTVLSTLFIPITGFLIYLVFWIINSLFAVCTERQYYTECTKPGGDAVWPLLIVVPTLVLWFLYSRVHIKKPVIKAVLVALLVVIAFIAELFGGAVLLMNELGATSEMGGVGGVGYLILASIIAASLVALYHRLIEKEVSDGGVDPTIQATYPAQKQVTEHHDEGPTNPPEPPQQNPPATSVQ